MYRGKLLEFGQSEPIFMKAARRETEDCSTGRVG